MKRPSFSTKVGSTADGRTGADLVLAHEPEAVATLRTKGHLYLVCEVPPGSEPAARLAREVVQLTREEYYYYPAAPAETSLRKALHNANRRAWQRLREMPGPPRIHVACAVVVGSEVHAAQIGEVRVFLLRQARLFVPGDRPGELADFAHHALETRTAALGAEHDFVPAVWRQAIEAGDTLILASGSVLEGLGSEALKTAAITLHPRAAAERVRERFAAEGHPGSGAAAFIEITPAARTRRPIAVRASTTTEDVWRRRPPADPVPVATRAVELLPKTVMPLPPALETSLRPRRQLVTTIVALALLLGGAGLAALLLRDFQSDQVVRDYETAVQRVEEEIGAARRLAGPPNPEPQRARERLASASLRLEEAARSAAVDPSRVAALRDEIEVVRDQTSNVVLDLARLVTGSRPAQFAASGAGLYVADPGAGVLWRLFGDPLETGVVLRRGERSMGTPLVVATLGDAVFSVDEQNRIWKAVGAEFGEVLPEGTDKWRSVTAFTSFFGNLYVLDAASGQLWKHEGDDGGFDAAVPFLATPLAPDTALSVAVDGDVWVVTRPGEVLRFRRQGLATAASRIDFSARWDGEPVRPSAIQALESQRSIYFLDQAGRRVVRMTRDGRETARFSLPPELDPPTAFYVSEASGRAYTFHGSKLVITDLNR